MGKMDGGALHVTFVGFFVQRQPILELYIAVNSSSCSTSIDLVHA